MNNTSEELSVFAKFQNKDAVLWSKKNSNLETTYVSLGDVGISNFLKILLDADQIIYHNKSSEWSSLELKNLTDNVIYLLGINGFYSKIYNFPFKSFVLEKNLLYKHLIESDITDQILIQKICNYYKDNFLGLVAHRRSFEPQIWIAGCSYAKGAHVDISERYGSVIAKFFGYSSTNIAHSGSSIDFAADQIIRSNLRSGDLLIWGITGPQRFTWFDTGHVENVNWGHIDEKVTSDKRKKFLNSVLVDDSRLYLSQRHIEQVQRTCDKIGCNLILIYHETLGLSDHILPMKKFLSQYPGFVDINQIMIEKFGADRLNKNYNVDLAADYLHPGRKTHSAWAEILINFIKSKKYMG